MTDFKASVGLSRKWDAYEAGIEVTRDALNKLKTKPDFFLLFTTIHYRKNGGFDNLLKGVKEVLSEGTPLVGCTVPGFINNYGCYTRGATGLAVSCPEMTVAKGYGTKTKKKPGKAADDCASMIEGGLGNSPYSNKFLFDCISGSIMINIGGQGFRNIIRSEIMSSIITKTLGLMQKILQKGMGNEDVIFEKLTKRLHDYSMILVNSTDDCRGFNNYQFFGDKVMTNSLVSLGFATDLDLDVCTTHGMKKTRADFEITKLTKDGHIIQEINGKPAIPQLQKMLHWPRGFLEKDINYDLFYYPLYLRSHGRKIPNIIGFIMKDYIVTPCKVEKGEASVFGVSGKDLLDALDENLRSLQGIEPELILSSVCYTLLITLGNHMKEIRKKMIEKFGGKPFLMLFSQGEGTYSPKRGMNYANMSFNTAIFGREKNIL